MFRGITNLNLDAKGRMAMPARYRERLMESCQGRLVITIDRDGCLLVYPLPVWERIEEALVSRPNMDRKTRRMQRLLVGHATECELDGQGRILLPTPLRDYAGLDKRAVLVGQGKKFELWDEDAWTRSRDAWLQEEDEDGDPSSTLESLVL
ncbi:protein MraZ [Ectothiorhodospira haloalkaliphila]|uniref:Transcriptional regulator MraZ n=1 Tax=Ectothiorhodospira haloalkaliphila TaxID=421628 RepID=W8L2U9_9GAMM|nr:division/cell wall cluster transcriptional repressor MraZ [Ectothiorhodospira haloalkaliphila]MCG5493408.1 division/cell wall cluster transcriptional repressor MraZ [Ectothiorhodospira variabilis]AHK78250.1 protein MraZ [Ectothiorhodospira haloalkaliphila]MCG5496754.1 division/cell wall cluster transcriptional repressor MraZ [Ectothiorhodospira variabilis]MCG5502737.1 division/cell wall cluster transcriptional repressor MraZ [Ectothiorhodospira variabilis]MCG5505497.1 division/cell wall clu